MQLEAGLKAVITGAGGGLGSALAYALAKRGVDLALADISPDTLEKTRADVAGFGGQISTHVVDVTSREAMETFCANVIATHGQVNLLINNAGITLQKKFLTHSLDDWDRVININLRGVIYGCHFFAPYLVSGKAHVVNLSSMSAFVGLPGQSSYCVTKSGVQYLSDCLWAEWYEKGIGMTSVHPGAIRTHMIKATLKESDNPEQAMKNYEIAHKTGVDAAFAAKKIIAGIEKNKMRVKIGLDAHLIHFVMRFIPGFGNWVMKKVAYKLNAQPQP